ncbi:Trp biosynthesis-associated membrane protein [Geodermatophilus sp. SYSU D00814]
MSRRRRELGVALAGCALAGALALTAAGQTWSTVTVTRRPPLPPVTEALTGSALAPLVPAAGLLLLAAAVAVLAVRGAGRAAVGALVVLAGAALAWSGLRVLTGAADPGTAAPGERRTADLAAAWPVLCLVAAVVALAAGGLVLARGRRWPGMGGRYERTPAAAPAPARARTDEERALDAWRALDRGDDPTDEPTDDGEPAGDPAPGPPDRRR